MTKEEIKALVSAKIAGQGNQVDLGNALPAIIDEIIDLIPEGGGASYRRISKNITAQMLIDGEGTVVFDDVADGNILIVITLADSISSEQIESDSIQVSFPGISIPSGCKCVLQTESAGLTGIESSGVTLAGEHYITNCFEERSSEYKILENIEVGFDITYDILRAE